MSTYNRIISFFQNIGPIGSVLAFFLFFITIFSINRILLSFLHFPDVITVSQYWRIFTIGFRMDTIILSMVVGAPTILLLLLPPQWMRYWKPVLTVYFAVFGAVLVLVEGSTLPFLEEYGMRPNYLFIEYLRHPIQIFSIIFTGYKIEFLVITFLIFLVTKFIWTFTGRLINQYNQWTYKKRLIILPLIIFLLVLGGRSSLSDSPANLGTAAFSNDSLVNELASNSFYSVAYFGYLMAVENENLKERYGDLPQEEIISRVKEQMNINENEFISTDSPLMHKQMPVIARNKPANLVIILSESLSATFIGELGGQPLSPNFDALSREGLLLTNLLATGTRTNRGIESLVSGVLPLPIASIIKLRLAQNDFFTMPQLLKNKGYKTSFIYGGDSNFDNMKRFLTYNGIQKIIDQDDFTDDSYQNHWGVADEYVFNKANDQFKTYKNDPFVSIVLTLSNHEPYEFPDDRIKLYEQPKNTANNAAKYADYALGKFFEQAKKEDYYKNTVFLIVADHGIRMVHKGPIPIKNFHIPALIIGPNVTPGHYSKLASQIDLLPTVTSLLGIPLTHPMPGRNLLTLPEHVPGRALYQYGSNYAFQIENNIVIQFPNRNPRQFVIDQEDFREIPVEDELAKSSLAHILMADFLYREKKYSNY